MFCAKLNDIPECDSFDDSFDESVKEQPLPPHPNHQAKPSPYSLDSDANDDIIGQHYHYEDTSSSGYDDSRSITKQIQQIPTSSSLSSSSSFMMA